MLDKLTKETFEPLKGDTFSLTHENGVIPLSIVAVLGTGLQGHAAREQFSVHFRGPSSPVLPQRIYRIEHPQLGALEIFIVPIKRDGDGLIYEAVFT